MRTYLLPSDQVERLREAGGPLADLSPEQLAQLERASIAVVEIAGRIVAYWVVFYALHAEPLWVAPSARLHPGILRSLLEQTGAIIAETGEATTFAIIDPADAAAVHGVLPDRLGFARVPGDLYYLSVPQEGS